MFICFVCMCTVGCIYISFRPSHGCGFVINLSPVGVPWDGVGVEVGVALCAGIWGHHIGLRSFAMCITPIPSLPACCLQHEASSNAPWHSHTPPPHPCFTPAPTPPHPTHPRCSSSTATMARRECWACRRVPSCTVRAQHGISLCNLIRCLMFRPDWCCYAGGGGGVLFLKAPTLK